MRMVAVGCVHLVGCFWALSPRPETVVQHLLHFVTLNGLLFLTKHRVEAAWKVLKLVRMIPYIFISTLFD